MRSPSGTGARPTSTRTRYGPGAGTPAGLRPRPAGRFPRTWSPDYLAERGAADIPMPGGLARADWLARRPVLREPFTAQLGWRRPTAHRGVRPMPPLRRSRPPPTPASRCRPAWTAPAGLPRRSGAAEGPANHPAARLQRWHRPARHARPGGPDGDDDEASAQARISGQRLRESAHRYLEEGLWPVPAWAARQSGECCCPRGADCPRPGKHPRSVHAGPGPRDYSWKPLACRTHAEVDQRFAPGSRYAAGNLMVAIPRRDDGHRPRRR